jgi:hypothetical protein
MMTIRSDQMLLFSKLARKRFEDQMVTHMQIRSRQGDCLPEPQLRERVIALIASAESHQIDYEDDVQHYIELFFDRSPDVFQDPDVNAILKSNDVSSSSKVAFLNDTLSSKGILDVQ